MLVELFESKEVETVETPEDYDPVPAEVADPNPKLLAAQPQEGQSLVQTIVMILGGIILVILIILFARWIYHVVHNNDDNTSTTVNQPSRPNKAPNNQPGTGGLPSNNPSNNQNGNPLPNSGPGNVAAVFAASTLAAAGLHYIISLRRFNKIGR